MAYKILEANGVDNENVDGGALNRFIARNKSGIIGGVLSECALTATGSQVGVSPGLLMLCGIRVKITEIETLGFSALPVEPIEYQIVAQVTLGSNGVVDFSLFLQLPATLIQEELYVSGRGTYQVELGRFTHATDGSITNLKQTLQIIGEADGGSSISEWDGSTYYTVGDMVIYNGNIYRCISEDPAGDEPSEYPDSWELISKGEKPRGALSIIATFNITEANTVITLQDLVGMTSIDWGDGTTDSNLTHTYTAVGEYTAKIYGVTIIGQQAFKWCDNLTSVAIGNSVTSIEYEAFTRCDNLTSITIPDSVTNVVGVAGCSSLPSITIPHSVTKLGAYAFYDNRKMTSATIGNGVKKIDYRTFWYCMGLLTVTIGSGVTTIGEGAFQYCYNLTTIIINAIEPPILESDALDKCTSLTKIIVPAESLETYKTAWSDYATLIDCYLPSKNYAKLDEINTFSQPFKMWYSDSFLMLYSNSLYIGENPNYTGTYSELTKARLRLNSTDCSTSYGNGVMAVYEGDASYMLTFPRETGTLATRENVAEKITKLTTTIEALTARIEALENK